MGTVPYQALPLLRFFACKFHAREKVRKGEGEPGDEAIEVLHMTSQQCVSGMCRHIEWQDIQYVPVRSEHELSCVYVCNHGQELLCCWMH